jgi:hypothetical protein
MSEHPILLTRLLATPGALAALATASRELTASSPGISPATGASSHPRAANVLALVTGNALRSVYRTRLGVPLWIVTEADRSSTCIFLSDEA